MSQSLRKQLLAPVLHQALFQGPGQRNEKTDSIPASGSSYPFSLIADLSHGCHEQFYTGFNPFFLPRCMLEFANEMDLSEIGKGS